MMSFLVRAVIKAMPELPEVETVRRQLEKRLQGARILGVNVWQSDKERPQGEVFASALNGKMIARLERRGKLLLWRFSDGSALAIHLKMTGKLTFYEKKPDAPANRHERLLFTFQQGSLIGYLAWSDVRRFGYLRLLDQAETDAVLAEYGPEPLTATVETLVDRLMTPSTRPLKAILLDQSVIAGIGNIYADEACFLSKIHPARRIQSLKPIDFQTLAMAIKDILARAVDQRGTSAHTYVDTEGKKGGFLQLLQVYGRAGQPCLRCKTPIAKCVLAGRGTHICLTCQPLKGKR